VTGEGIKQESAKRKTKEAVALDRRGQSTFPCDCQRVAEEKLKIFGNVTKVTYETPFSCTTLAPAQRIVKGVLSRDVSKSAN
jgi:hypothetical protein